MLSEEEALIAGEDDERVFRQTFFVEVIQNAADVFIHTLHTGQIVVHVSLVAPLHELLAGQIGGAVFFIARAVIVIPVFSLICIEIAGRHQLQIAIRHGALDAHVVIAHSLGAAFESVKKRRGFFVNSVLIKAEVPKRWLPLAVRRFVLAHQHERLRFVAALQPVDREIADDIGHVAFVLHRFAVIDHRWIVIGTLPRQDVPIVKAGRVGAEVPFPDDGRRVSGLLHRLGEGGLLAVEAAVAVVVEAVRVRILAGQNGSATRAADGIGNEAAIKAHALPRQAINGRCIQQLPAISVGADRLTGEVVGEEEDNVWRWLAFRLGGEGENESGGEKQESNHGYGSLRNEPNPSRITPNNCSRWLSYFAMGCLASSQPPKPSSRCRMFSNPSSLKTFIDLPLRPPAWQCTR